MYDCTCTKLRIVFCPPSLSTSARQGPLYIDILFKRATQNISQRATILCLKGHRGPADACLDNLALANAWGPPRVKVRGGNKGSWTERQIGILLSYFVLIKLSVIKCLFNYDNAIIINLSYIHLNHSKTILIVSLA